MNDVPTRLLRETLQARVPAVPSPACLDADTLAAWADDALRPDEREAAEAHAADCARCQMLLAAMATTAPPETAGRSWWRLPAMRWLVPLTVATTALLVWVSVPRSVVGPSTSSVMREATAPQPQASVGAAPDAQPPATLLLPPAGPAAVVAPRAAANPRRDKELAAKSDALKESTADSVRDEARQSAAAQARPEADNRVAAAAPKAEPTGQLAAAGAAAQRPAADVAPPAPPPAPAPAPALQRSATAPPVAMSARMFDAAPPLIVSTNRAVVWRIATSGAVERSADGGSTWQRQSTGVTVTLTSGAAPSASICWLIGPQGTVLLTTDGRSWNRVPFPETIDLVSVRASDDKSATVTTADGRAFSTTDGGLTWKRS